MLTLIIFFPSFFAVITVILHGWRCTSTGSILTADSFLFKRKKEADLLHFFFYLNWEDLAAVRSSFLTGPIESQSLRLALQHQNQRW